MKKYIYSFLIGCLLLGSTPNIKGSYGCMDYIYLITDIIGAATLVINIKLLYEIYKVDLEYNKLP